VVASDATRKSKPAHSTGGSPVGAAESWGSTRPIRSDTRIPEELTMNDTTRPTSVRVIADHCDGPHRTDSDDICTGTGATFDRCEFVSRSAS